MNLRFLLLTAGKELRLRRRDPMAVVVWLAVTLILSGLMTLFFGGDSQANIHGRLLVADQDDSFASMLVSGAFSQGPLGEIFTVEKVDIEEGRRRMDDGDASGLLIIPAGFGDAVLRDQRTRLELVTNPSQRILPKMLSETLDLLSEASFYVQTIGRAPLNRISHQISEGGETTDETVAEISVAVRQTFSGLSKYVDPPLIALAEQKKADAEESEPFNIGRLFFPSALFMTLLFMAQGLSGEIWTEREQGTLRRVASTPGSLAGFAAGRTLAFAVLLGGIAAVALPAGVYMLGVGAAHPLVAIGWVTLSGSVFYLFMTVLQMFAGSARTGNLIGGILVFPLAMVGGAFFPFEAMPAGMAAIGRRTPNGYALELFKSLLNGGVDWAAAAQAFAVAAALILALFPLVARLLRTRFLHG